MTIADNDTATLPTVTLAATDAAASETSPNPGRFTFTRTGPTTSPLTVVFTVGGTATSGSDFTAVGTSVTIAIGQSTALVDINPIDDSVVEAPETVVLQIAANAAYTIGAPSSGTVTIADNDVGALVQFVTPTLDIGQNLQVQERVRISAGNAPAGGLALRIVSSSPNVLLSATDTGAGAQTLNVTILANTAESPTFFVYSLASSGTASLTVEIVTTPNPGFSPGTPASVTMAPAGYELLCQQIGCTINGQRAWDQHDRPGGAHAALHPGPAPELQYGHEQGGHPECPRRNDDHSAAVLEQHEPGRVPCLEPQRRHSGRRDHDSDHPRR